MNQQLQRPPQLLRTVHPAQRIPLAQLPIMPQPVLPQARNNRRRPPPPQPVPLRRKRQEFRRCMRDHGPAQHVRPELCFVD